MQNISSRHPIFHVSVRLRQLSILFATALTIAVLIAGKIYADSGTWVDGSYPILTIGHPAELPPLSSCFPSLFSYFTYTKPDGVTFDATGRIAQTRVCASQNSLGLFGAASNAIDDNNFIKPKTSIAFRIVKANDAAATVTPVPGQAVFFTKDSSNSFYGEVAPHFYDSFTSAGTFGQFSIGNGTAKELALQLNQPGITLKDAAGKTIYMHAYAFSPNGQWMAIEAAGLGFVRVNTVTRQMQLFSTQILSYNLGFTPKVNLAISNDGNRVIESGKNLSNTYAYDLTNCQPSPFTIGANNTAAVTGCRSRVLTQSLASQFSGFAYLIAMRFNDDGQSLNLFVGHTQASGAVDFYSAIYAVDGYQQPHLGYLALGDSFSSGEGEFGYVAGTDSDSPKNKCHLSVASYPFLATNVVGINDFHNIACSGAKSSDYYTAQSNENKVPSGPLADWIPGYQAQGKYLYGQKTDVVTISMIGNDIDFSGKLENCIALVDDCFHFKEDRQAVANEVYNKFDTLVGLYNQIRIDAGNPDVKIYVLGYPQIFSDGSCDLNVSLSLEERNMAQGLTSYLDAVIHAAADKAGVQYIDTEEAFDGHRLCQDGTKAVNGLMAGSDYGPISSGSFHPNPIGHALLAQALLSQSQNFTSAMPAANSTVTPPYVGSSAYNAFIGDAPSANLQGLLYTSPTTLVVRTALGVANAVIKTVPLTIAETELPLKANTAAQVWFHSTPTLAGTLTTDAQGGLSGQVTIPDTVQPGYHTIHVITKDMGGEDVDMYQTVYVAASETDGNGNGVPDNQESCVVVPSSGVDVDRDGIDDACDPEIGPAPIDVTPPIVTSTPDRQPDYGDWYNHSTTIYWLVKDPEPSSGQPSQPSPTTADKEGVNSYTSDPSCDPLNNCATGKTTIKLDTTPPKISYTLSPNANDNSWNNSAVTANFSCSDALSGIAQCPEAQLFSADGTYDLTGVTMDQAGNTAGTSGRVAIDTTPPTITNEVSAQPNKNGWYSAAVTITPTCHDALSGVAYCTGQTKIETEGKDQVFAAHVLDKADNSASTSSVINLDQTAPTISYTVSPAANSRGWNNGAVTVSFHCSDALSGISTCSDPLTLTDDGAYVATGWAVDNAGNSNAVNVFVSVDSTAPTLVTHRSAEANTNGWNNTGVSLTTDCADTLSGIAFCSSDQTVSGEGSHTITSVARDNADNETTRQLVVDIDTTAPTISSLTWSGNPKATTTLATLTLGVSDNLSGADHTEYFLGDTDPGLGSGVALTPSGTMFTASFGTNLATGVYKITARAADKAGNWSAPVYDYLVVYNPLAIRMDGRRTVMPSLAGGDQLPGLTSTTQTDLAKFAVSVGYDSLGHMLASDFQFSYKTGTKCERPAKALNCHTVDLNATSVDWFMTQGTNSATGVLQGRATLVVDGTTQAVIYTVTGLDGERLNASSADHLDLKIFAATANPNTATPLYQLDDDVLRGNIHIKI